MYKTTSQKHQKIELAKLFKYKKNDFLFDIEIRGNLFTNSQIYPEKKQIIVSFLEELPTKHSTEEIVTEIQTTTSSTASSFVGESEDILMQDIPLLAKKRTKTAIIEKDETTYIDGFFQKTKLGDYNNYQVIPHEENIEKAKQCIRTTLREVDDFEIIFENLAIYNDFLSFAKRYGYYNQQIVDLKNKKNPQYDETIFGDYSIISETDDSYNPELHGYKIGYNCLSYDLTMNTQIIASIMNDVVRLRVIADIKDKKERKKNPDYIAPEHEKSKKAFYDIVINQTSQGINTLSPWDLVLFNNQLFKSKYPMQYSLGASWHNTPSVLSYDKNAKSNRIVDVMLLNSKRMSLKRAGLNLGLRIQESADNGHPETRMKTLQDAIDLIVYNINDDLLTNFVFDEPAYQNQFNQNMELFKSFPYIIYNQDEKSDKKFDYIKRPDNVQPKRVTVNSTSTQIVTSVIAPYDNTKIKDSPCISYMYPHANVAKEFDKAGKLPKEFNGKPMHMFDYIRLLIEKNMKPVIAEKYPDKYQEILDNFDKIQKFYQTFEGKNVNDELSEVPYVKLSDLKKEDHCDIQYVTMEPYITKFGQKLGSLVRLSTGGIHGVEFLLGEYEKDLEKYKATQKSIQDLLHYHQTYDDSTLTLETLPDFIANMDVDVPYTHIKRRPLPINESLTYGDIISSDSSRKLTKLQRIGNPPQIFGKTKINKKYAYISVDKCGHEDFESYYVCLLSRLGCFINSDGDDVFTDGIYLPRAKLKGKAKHLWEQIMKDMDDGKLNMEYLMTLLRSDSLKLLGNSATGAADKKSKDDRIATSTIKCNNNIMSMRIIGQIFAWYIGQSLAIYNARIPSSNTDGLYSMNIDIELNKEIVARCSKEIILNIEAEPLDLFVTKDSNNRLEAKAGKIISARGASLTSWEGPSTKASITHPAMVDLILARYLATKENACDSVFDEAYAKQLIREFVKEYQKDTPMLLRYLQFPIISRDASLSYNFLSDLDDPTKTQIIQHTNRAFLVKREYSNVTIKSTGLTTIIDKSIQKLIKQTGSIRFRDLIEIDPIAYKIIKEQVSKETLWQLLDQDYHKNASTPDEKPRNIQIVKITDFPIDQPVIIVNEDLRYVEPFIKKIDFNAYLNIIRFKLENQWLNRHVLDQLKEQKK